MIYVFDRWTPQNGFNSCGERILNPTKCIIHHDLNGDYSLELHQPITPEDDCYTKLELFNVIKVSSGQLFPIYYIQKRIENNVPTLIVKARHMFYYLNDKILSWKLVMPNPTLGNSLHNFIGDIFMCVEHKWEETLNEYSFSYETTIDGLKKYEAEDIPVSAAIFEVNDLFEGELYRDNFFFAIDKTMRNSRQDSFTAIHGWNMAEITETVDGTDQLTITSNRDDKGTTEWRERNMGDGRVPHHVQKRVRFAYDGPSNLESDSDAYFRHHCFFQFETNMTSYEIDMKDLSDSSREAGWGDLERANVGDSGTVYSNILGINTYQRVVSTDFNELTQRNEKVKLQNFRKSSLAPDRLTNSISKYSADSKRISALERQSGFFEFIK